MKFKEGFTMDRAKTVLTVFFEGPFWVGVFERFDDGKLSVCKITFRSEPKDQEVWDFVLRNYYTLKFSPALETSVREEKRNPKRRLREAKKQTMQKGIGTKSQQALQLQREERKTERRQISREQKAADQQRKFDLKQRKRREKHRGR